MLHSARSTVHGTLFWGQTFYLSIIRSKRQREEYNNDCKNASDHKSDDSEHLTRQRRGMRCAEYTTRRTTYFTTHANIHSGADGTSRPNVRSSGERVRRLGNL